MSEKKIFALNLKLLFDLYTCERVKASNISNYMNLVINLVMIASLKCQHISE